LITSKILCHQSACTLHEKTKILTFHADGGNSVIAKVNGKPVCESKAVYGGTGATMGGGMGGAGGHPHGRYTESELDPTPGVWETIGEMTQCYGPIKVSKGDTIEMEATYDMNKHPA
jgi:hypothetical protein